MTATLTTRPAYTGPRSKWTRPDGLYRIVVSIPLSDLPVGDRETPALAHAALRVAAALGRPGAQGTTAIVGTIWPRFSPHPVATVAQVEVEVAAGSDEEAVEVFERLSARVGSVCGVCQYLRPTERGAFADASTVVARVEHPLADLGL